MAVLLLGRHMVMVRLMHEQQADEVHSEACHGDGQQAVCRHIVAAHHDMHCRLQHDVERHKHEDDRIGKPRQHTHPADEQARKILSAAGVRLSDGRAAAVDTTPFTRRNKLQNNLDALGAVPPHWVTAGAIGGALHGVVLCYESDDDRCII